MSIFTASEPATPEQSPEPAVVPVLAESVEIRKVAVDRGGYKVTKRVEERREIVDVMLSRRDADVERRPIGRPLNPGEETAPYYDGETLVIPVVEEVLVTEKRLMLVEEVRVRVTERELPFTHEATLREERVAVERIEPEIADDPPESAAR
jgi:uncharacterized protein (TIGR02271 family)